MSKRSLVILDQEEQSIRIKIVSLEKRKESIQENIETMSDTLEDLIDAQRLIKLYSPNVMLSPDRQIEEKQ